MHIGQVGSFNGNHSGLFFPRLISKLFLLVLFYFRVEIILESYFVAKVVLFIKVLSTLVQSPMN